MTQQPSRRHIAVSVRDYERATALRDALAERSGRKVTISGTVGRALECLEDSHSRRAWLSPSEAGPVLTERLRDTLASAFAQFIGREMPERRLKGIAFRSEQMVVIFEDDTEAPLYVPMVAGESRELH